MTELALFFGFLSKIGLGHKITEIILTFFFTLILILILFWIVRKPIIKFGVAIYKALDAVPKMEEAMEKMNKTVAELKDNFQESMAQTDLRMSAGDDRFNSVEKDIIIIKAQLSALTKGDM